MKRITGYLNSSTEAYIIMHSTRLGLMKATCDRLRPEERSNIESGDIFCFIKNECKLKRWTDRNIWSPSRISGEFLVYQEVPRHLSKNSIKKRRLLKQLGKEDDMEYINTDYVVSKTTLHKKTISLTHEGVAYQIISYYRPAFVNNTLIENHYFQQLKKSLDKYPLLLNNDYINTCIMDENFYNRHEISSDFSSVHLNCEDRKLLENIAVEVLVNLYKQNIKNRSNVKYD